MPYLNRLYGSANQNSAPIETWLATDSWKSWPLIICANNYCAETVALTSTVYLCVATVTLRSSVYYHCAATVPLSSSVSYHCAAIVPLSSSVREMNTVSRKLVGWEWTDMMSGSASVCQYHKRDRERGGAGCQQEHQGGAPLAWSTTTSSIKSSMLNQVTIFTQKFSSVCYSLLICRSVWGLALLVEDRSKVLR